MKAPAPAPARRRKGGAPAVTVSAAPARAKVRPAVRGTVFAQAAKRFLSEHQVALAAFEARVRAAKSEHMDSWIALHGSPVRPDDPTLFIRAVAPDGSVTWLSLERVELLAEQAACADGDRPTLFGLLRRYAEGGK